MKNPIALQMWSVRDAMRADFAAAVKKVAELGYGAVELAGTGNLGASDAARAVRDAGLQVAGMHVGLKRLRADLEGVIEEAELFGAPYVTCPSWPGDDFATAYYCQRAGEELSEIGEELDLAGLKFGFHNHGAELAVVEGRRVLDWMLDAAEPRYLLCQLDVYWAHVGGANPAAYIREQGRRIKQVHLKDEKELGLGPVDFPSVFGALDQIGAVEWFIVEQEKYNHEPFESLRLCYEQLKAWGRV